MELISHPFTIAMLMILAAAGGWMITTLIQQGKDITAQQGSIALLTKTAADIRELLEITRKEQEAMRRDLGDLMLDHAALAGEHKKKH